MVEEEELHLVVVSQPIVRESMSVGEDPPSSNLVKLRVNGHGGNEHVVIAEHNEFSPVTASIFDPVDMASDHVFKYLVHRFHVDLPRRMDEVGPR